MNYDKIGKFITTSRKRKGLTQKELANLLHITDRAVSKWERGKGCPDISLLEDLSKVLDVSIIELLKGEQIRNKEKIEKKELLYSMNYVKSSIKEKVYNTINIVIITLISIIILLIVFNNLKINILFNQHYYPNIMFVGSENIFEEIENKINSIKKDNVNYQNQDYNEILNIIDKHKAEDKELYNKEYYTYNDIKNIMQSDNLYSVSRILNLSINNISNNINWNNNIVYFADSFYQNKNKIKNFINNCYKYNYVHNAEESIGNTIKNLIHDKYYIYSLILEDIANGGETNE